jgi:hypothetical protein
MMATTDADSVRGIGRGDGECRPVGDQSGSGTAPKMPTEPFLSVGQETSRPTLLGDDDSSRLQRLSVSVTGETDG